jgi:hypothetical protein
LGSRRAAGITAILGFFTGFLITDGYTAYQQLLPQLAGIQQCAAHVIRRCRAVTKLGPGRLQSWAADVIDILRKAHRLVEQAQARDGPVDAEALAALRERYDKAVAFGITHNRLRDWHEGNHPGYVLGCWLRDYADQVWLFTHEPAVAWTNNISEQAVKAAKRHQAVSGHWHTQDTLARWCRIRSYLDSAAAYGRTALEAVTTALAGKPWLPPPFAPAAALNPSSLPTPKWTHQQLPNLGKLILHRPHSGVRVALVLGKLTELGGMVTLVGPQGVDRGKHRAVVGPLGFQRGHPRLEIGQARSHTPDATAPWVW